MLVALVLATLAGDLSAIARLPGEPSAVAAAGVTADEQPILTIEAPGSFDDSPKRRVVVIGTPDAVVDAVRWMKTRATKAIRQQWLMSALADTGIDPASRARWITFQAADVVLDLGGRDPHPTDTVRAALERAAAGRSAGHDTIARRVGREPLTIAKLLAQRYPGTPSISYIPSVAWSNTLKFAAVTGDASLREKVERQTAPWRVEHKDLFGNRTQLTSVAGTLIFAELGANELAIAGAEAASAVKAGDVYEHGQGWTDDMFMATSVLARTAKLPGRGRDLELAARMLAAYVRRLQRPDGVFVHAADAPVAWGRGNGFAALGLAEALGAMSERDRARTPLLDAYRRQMDAARRLQAPDGMWNEVLDEPGSYREESATAMLLTAMSRGIRGGWIDRSFVPVVERAWRALAAHVAEDGTVIDVCTSTGAGPTKRYYLDRAALTGPDDRGGAMALMAAMEYLAAGRMRPLR